MDEPFANPVAPVSHHQEVKHQQQNQSAAPTPKQPLTNEDFRKLMMTPKVGQTIGVTPSVSHRIPGSVRSTSSKLSASQSGRRRPVLQESDASVSSQEHHHKHDKSKKDFFKQKSKEPREDDILTELASRYRDRAKERREGANPDYDARLDDLDNMTHHHRSHAAIGPDAKSRIDFQEKRKREIEESKFLGGDMEHTHLVKGLDYALLQKVKAEISSKERGRTKSGGDSDQEQDEDAEGSDQETKRNYSDWKKNRHRDEDQRSRKKSKSSSSLPDVPDVPMDDGDCADNKETEDDAPKSVMAANIIKFLNQKLPERNLLFLPMRMAYVVDLESEETPSCKTSIDDIPLTVIRSKSECPNHDSLVNPSTSDIVINKLIQIISSHRREEEIKQEKQSKAAASALSSFSSNSFSWMSRGSKRQPRDDDPEKDDEEERSWRRRKQGRDSIITDEKTGSASSSSNDNQREDKRKKKRDQNKSSSPEEEESHHQRKYKRDIKSGKKSEGLTKRSEAATTATSSSSSGLSSGRGASSSLSLERDKLLYLQQENNHRNKSILGSFSTQDRLAFGSLKAAADLDIYDDLEGCDYIPPDKKK